MGFVLLSVFVSPNFSTFNGLDIDIGRPGFFRMIEPVGFFKYSLVSRHERIIC